MSMSHRESEIVPDGGASGTKGALSFKISCLYLEYENEKCYCQRRSGDCVTECTVQGGQKVRRSSAIDHPGGDCPNLVFYSAFYWQPVQIHKRQGGNMFTPRSLAHKTNSTVCVCVCVCV